MDEEYYEWGRLAEERTLARYVQADDLPDEFRLPANINRFDLVQARGYTDLAAQFYALIRNRAIQYDIAPFNPRSGVTQLIRRPATILGQKRGTCLDLALLFATMCLATDLLPLIVVVEGHAFAGLSLTRTRQDAIQDAMNNVKLSGFAKWDRGMLTNLSVLKKLAGEEYLFVECTGAAQSKVLSPKFPEGRGRDESGFMSFERACEAGREHIVQHIRMKDESEASDKRVFLYALDIHDLQVKHGFEPVQPQSDTNIDGDYVARDKITYILPSESSAVTPPPFTDEMARKAYQIEGEVATYRATLAAGRELSTSESLRYQDLTRRLEQLLKFAPPEFLARFYSNS